MTYTLLLQAALADPQDANKAWEHYCHRGNPQEEDHASIALFPLIYRRFKPTAFEYKSVYRHTWCSNQIQLIRFKQMLEQLQKASIEVCLLQDAAVALAYYQDIGTRAFDSLEVLVSPEEFQKTLHCLKGMEINVRCSLFSESRIDPLFRNFHCRQIPLAQFPMVTILCPEDQLLLTLFQSLKYRSSKKWIPDAAMILQKTPSFEWEYFRSQVKSIKLEWAIYQAIRHLCQYQLIKLPSHLMTLFERDTPTRKELNYFKFLKKKTQSSLSVLQFYWHSHHRSATSQHLLILLWTFPRFFKNVKQFTHWSEVFFFFCFKLFCRKRSDA